MEVQSGDCFELEVDGKQITVQAIYPLEGGQLWACTRSDYNTSDTALILSTKELLNSLGENGDK